MSRLAIARSGLLGLLILSSMVPSLLQAQGEGEPRAIAEDLEAGLAGTVGEERLELLVALTQAHLGGDAAKAVAAGSEALVLLAEHPDNQRHLVLLKALGEGYEELGETEALVRTLNQLGLVYQELRRYEEALPVYSRARELAEAAGHRAWLAKTLRNTGDIHGKLGRLDRRLDLYEQALVVARELQPRELADALSQLGRLCRRVDELARAHEVLVEAVELFEELGETDRLAQHLMELGIVHRKLERWQEALELYHRALRLAEEIGDRHRVGTVLNSIAIVYGETGRQREALELYEKSLAIAEAREDHWKITTGLANIGRTHNQLGDLDRALEFYQRSLAMRERLGDPEKLARGYAAVGGIYQQMGEFELAKPYLERALEIWDRPGSSKQELAYVLGTLGTIHREQGRYEAARAALERVVELITESGLKAQRSEALRELAETYAAMGRDRDALAIFRRYEEALIEKLEAKNSQTVHEMQSRFDADRKRKAIELLEHRQDLSDLELERQRDVRWALIAGFGLLPRSSSTRATATLSSNE